MKSLKILIVILCLMLTGCASAGVLITTTYLGSSFSDNTILIKDPYSTDFMVDVKVPKKISCVGGGEELSETFRKISSLYSGDLNKPKFRNYEDLIMFEDSLVEFEDAYKYWVNHGEGKCSLFRNEGHVSSYVLDDYISVKVFSSDQKDRDTKVNGVTIKNTIEATLIYTESLKDFYKDKAIKEGDLLTAKKYFNEDEIKTTEKRRIYLDNAFQDNEKKLDNEMRDYVKSKGWEGNYYTRSGTLNSFAQSYVAERKVVPLFANLNVESTKSCTVTYVIADGYVFNCRDLPIDVVVKTDRVLLEGDILYNTNVILVGIEKMNTMMGNIKQVLVVIEVK